MRSALAVGGRVALVVVSVLFALICLELGWRAWRGPYWLLHWPNTIETQVGNTMGWPVCSHTYDRRLGWSLTPNFASPAYNVGPDGFRRNAALPADAAGRPAVLATGDSFTEGDEVGDDETWPSYLQARLGRRGVNGGVSAYGLDQTVLRAEQAAASVHPAALVVSFI